MTNTELKDYYRTDEGKMFLGVFSGIQKYYGVNANLARAIFIVLCFATNVWSVIAYLVVALIVKNDSGSNDLIDEARESGENIKDKFMRAENMYSNSPAKDTVPAPGTVTAPAPAEEPTHPAAPEPTPAEDIPTPAEVAEKTEKVTKENVEENKEDTK